MIFSTRVSSQTPQNGASDTNTILVLRIVVQPSANVSTLHQEDSHAVSLFVRRKYGLHTTWPWQEGTANTCATGTVGAAAACSFSLGWSHDRSPLWSVSKKAGWVCVGFTVVLKEVGALGVGFIVVTNQEGGLGVCFLLGCMVSPFATPWKQWH